MTRLFLSAALLAIASSCSPADAPTPTAGETGPVLSYTDAFIMEPIGDRDLTMGGVTLSVEGGNVALSGASSTSIGAIELHTSEMLPVERFEIADGETLELKRRGNHLMMFDVGEDVISGETIDITLNFESDGAPMTLVIEADVRAVGE